jgi:hypothetical protein
MNEQTPPGENDTGNGWAIKVNPNGGRIGDITTPLDLVPPTIPANVALH